MNETAERSERTLHSSIKDSSPPAPFIVGMPDSGVEELRLVLDAHPDLAVPGPTFFVAPVLHLRHDHFQVRERFLHALVSSPTWLDHHVPIGALRRELGDGVFHPAGALRSFYRLYAARFGKQRWGDSTHRYGYHMSQIRTCLPEAHFVHVIRDGRDAAVLARLSHSWQVYGTVERHAEHWRERIESFRIEALTCPQSYLEIHYEALINDTRNVLMEICGFLQLSYSPLMLTYYERAAERLDELQGIERLGGYLSKDQRLRGLHAEILTSPPDHTQIERWRRELHPSEVAAYEHIAGDLLRTLEYGISCDPLGTL